MSLPKSAIETLEAAAESFRTKPISGVNIRRFDLPHARAGLAKAGKRGERGMVPAAIHEPRHGEALVVMRAADLSRLLWEVERNARGGNA